MDKRLLKSFMLALQLFSQSVAGAKMFPVIFCCKQITGYSL
jgi:hypothetical protein